MSDSVEHLKFRPRLGDENDVDSCYDCPRCGHIGKVRAATPDNLLDWMDEDNGADVRVMVGDPGGVVSMLGELALCRSCMKVIERVMLISIFGEELTERFTEIHRQRETLYESEPDGSNDEPEESNDEPEPDDESRDDQIDRLEDMARSLIDEHTLKVRKRATGPS